MPVLTRFIIALAAASTLAAGVADAQAANILPNPSFENGADGQPELWEARTPTDPQRELTWATDFARTGERSLRILNHERVLSRWRTGAARDFAVAPGSDFTVAGHIRTRGVTGSARLRVYMIREADEGGRYHTDRPFGAMSGDMEWVRVSAEFTAPTDPYYLMVYCELEGTGEAWFDDLELIGEPGPGIPHTLPPVEYGPREFEEREHYTVTMRNNRMVMEAPLDLSISRATAVFWEETGRYDVILAYLDEPDGTSTFRVLVNDEEVGSVVADETTGPPTGPDVPRDFTIPGVDIQRFSRITVVGEPDRGEYARVIAVRFRRVGPFQGEPLPATVLRPPDDLRIHRTPGERRQASGMLAAYGNALASRAFREATEELEALDTPAGLAAWQEDLRGNLARLFGWWPEPTPLNPRLTGAIERDDFIIEKVIIETQPRYYVPVNVYIPRGRPLPAPGVVMTCGHAMQDGKAAPLYHEFCLGLVKKGYVVAAFDPMGQGERHEYLDPPEGLEGLHAWCGEHWYFNQQAWLAGWTLSGLRTWDGVRVVDYLLSRPEVDPARVAVAGNSGGGQMTLLITACHPQVSAAAAAHPGGGMENTFYGGRGFLDRLSVSLIPPRPLRWIVGEDSGEEAGHRRRHDWIQPLYQMLDLAERQDFVLVHGVHDMRQPKREAAYPWLNRWLGMEQAGATEDELEPFEPKDLWCTETGQVQTSLGGETGLTIAAARMRAIAPPRPAPPAEAAARERFIRERTARVLARLGLDDLDAHREPPWSRAAGTHPHPQLRIEKVEFGAEAGIVLPALFMQREGATGPVVVHVAERGKPTVADDDLLPFRLALAGCRVLSVDVRGCGELDIEGGARRDDLRRDRIQQRRTAYAINVNAGGLTMPGRRALDLIRAMDYLHAREDIAVESFHLVGEGEGGSWALMAAIADDRVAGVAAVGMLASYRMALDNRWNRLDGYFWVPGALHDYDLPDLAALLAPRPVLLAETVDQLLMPITAAQTRIEYAWPAEWYRAARAPEALSIIEQGGAEAVVEALAQ